MFKDSTSRFWVKSHNIVIDGCLVRKELQPMAFNNDELLMYYVSHIGTKRTYTCNLEIGNFKRLGRTYEKYWTSFLTHNPSFVSLRNCKLEISLE